MLAGEKQYVNMHAHRIAGNANEWVIKNLDIHDYFEIEDEPDVYYSVGLHPWNIQQSDYKSSLRKISLFLENRQVLAIGETGLDKTIDTSMELQLKVFEQHIKIAENAGLPVIIHAVRTNQELLQLAKGRHFSVPMIIHGFRGNELTAGELLKAGFFLSVGHAILFSEKLQEAVKSIPIESLFIETDESEVDIEELYKAVAKIYGISISSLRTQMLEKVNRIFRRS